MHKYHDKVGNLIGFVQKREMPDGWTAAIITHWGEEIGTYDTKEEAQKVVVDTVRIANAASVAAIEQLTYPPNGRMIHGIGELVKLHVRNWKYFPPSEKEGKDTEDGSK